MSARAAVTLALANVAAGVLNYLFQVHAAIALDATAFGVLSAWLAQITLAGSVATVVQFLSLDFRSPRFEALLRPAGALSLVALVAQLAVGRGLSPFVLGVITVAGTVLMYAVIGQLQGRLRLADVGMAIFAAALARFSLTFVTSFYVAQAVAAFAAIVVAAAVASRHREPPAPAREARSGFGLRLARSVMLAFATVLFPQLDVLVLSWREDPTTLGMFSRVALAARIVFFAGAAVFPVLLPHQIRAAEDDTAPAPFVLFAQRWLPPGMIVGSLLLAVVADRAVLHTNGDTTTWLYLSCASSALLVSILVAVQRLAARARVMQAGACVAAVLVTSAVAVALSPGSVTRYTLVACVGNALVLALATVLASRP